MSGVQTTIALQDKLTGPLMKMIKAMDNTIKVMEKMDQSANSIDTKGLMNARKAIDSASADMARLASSANSASERGVKPLQQQFTNLPGPVNRAKSSIKSFFAVFAGAAAAVLSIRALKQGFDKLTSASDSYVSTSARLKLINDGLQTQEQLQNKIFHAAQRSRSAYGDMADSVAKLNMLAGDAFTGNDEVIQFGELMNKVFAVSGAGASEMQAGMHQLTQAMASGRLQGDEYVSIMENAPLLAKAIADSLGVTRGELKKLSSDGEITSDVIKNALFGAAQDIEEMFKTMPMTFAQAMTSIKNEALMAFEPLFIRFNDFVNSDAFTTLSGHVMAFINISVAGLMILFDVIESVYVAMSAIAEYWPVIAAGLGILLAVYFPAIMAWMGAMLFNLWLMIEPILAQAAAWAIVYWPITLIILAVMGLIAVLMYFGVTTEQILGFVGGLFFALGAHIWNVIAHIWNYIAMLAEFLINVFIDPVYAIKKLFYDAAMLVMDMMGAMAGSFDTAADVLAKVFVTAANIAIGGINMLIKALNMIPGVDIGEVGSVSAATTGTLSSGLKNMANSLKAPTSSKGVVSVPRMDYKSIPGAFKSGQSKGSSLKVPGFGGGATMPSLDMPNMDIGNLAGAGSPGGVADGKGKSPAGGKGTNPTGGKLDSIGKIDDEINIADEDLKLLRELADIRSIQNFVTLNPTTQLTGDLTIREEADIDKVMDRINETMVTSMKEPVEGVYS